MELEQSEGGSDTEQYYTEEQQPRTMSMRQALAESQGNEQGVLDSLNVEGQNSMFGALFEHEVV